MNDFYSNYQELPPGLSAEYDWQQRNRYLEEQQRFSIPETGNDDDLTTSLYSAYEQAVADGNVQDAKLLLRQIKKRTLTRNPDENLNLLKHTWDTTGENGAAIAYGTALIRTGQVVPFSVGYRMLREHLLENETLWARKNSLNGTAPLLKPNLNQALEINFFYDYSSEPEPLVTDPLYHIMKLANRMGWLAVTVPYRYSEFQVFFIHPSILDINIQVDWIPGASTMLASNAMLNPKGKPGWAVIVGQQVGTYNVWNYDIQSGEFSNGAYNILNFKSALLEYVKRLLLLAYSHDSQARLFFPDGTSAGPVVT